MQKKPQASQKQNLNEFIRFTKWKIMEYRREIDGLRAIAIAPVILYHAGFNFFKGGFVGVDVFFVISGYLITSIVINDIESGRFSIIGFYERRARRILPALFFVLAASVPIAWILLFPNDLKDFSTSLIAIPLFIRLLGVQKEIYELVKLHTGGDPFSRMIDNGACKFWSQELTSEFSNRFLNCTERFGSGIVILGDSHGMNVYNIAAKSNATPFVVGLVKPACRPHETHKDCQYDDFLKFASKNKQAIKKVIFHQSGSYLGGPNTLATIDYLGRLTGSVKVIWLGPHPEARFNFKDITLYQSAPAISDRVIKYFDALEGEIATTVLLSQIDIDYVKFSKIFSIGTHSLLIGSCITFRDDDHFSDCGENLIAPPMGNYLINHVL